MEGICYSDLRRWKLVEIVLNGFFYGMNYNGINVNDFYKRIVY